MKKNQKIMVNSNGTAFLVNPDSIHGNKILRLPKGWNLWHETEEYKMAEQDRNIWINGSK